MVIEKLRRSGRGGIFRGTRDRSFAFKLTRAIITTTFFSLIFWFLVLGVEKRFLQWLLTVFTVAFTMMIGSATARAITGSPYRDDKDFQYFTRWMLIVIIYSTFVWIFAVMGAYSRLNIWYVMGIFLFAKFVVFLLSDYLADKLSFGG